MSRWALPSTALGAALFLFLLRYAAREYAAPITGAGWFVFLPAAALLLGWAVWEYANRTSHAPSVARTRLVFVGLCIVAVPIVAVFQQAWIRTSQNNQSFLTHDGAVQTEAALTFLLDGENPYAADYRKTPFGRNGDFFSQGKLPNPAWDHYVYPPGYLFVSLPLAGMARVANIFYDQRLAHVLFLMGALAFLAYGIREESRPLAWALFGLNPVFVWLFVSGYNDIAVMAALTAAAILWKRQRIISAFFALGIAVTFKQSAVLFIPAFFIALTAAHRTVWKKAILAFVLPPLLAYGPFLIAGAGALIDDLVRFPSAGGIGAYPISGIGLSNLLLKAGVIAGDRDAYPFWILQALVALPLLLGMVLVLRRSARAWVLMLVSTVFTAFVWVVARYFNDSHLAFLLQMSIVTFILYHEKEPANAYA